MASDSIKISDLKGISKQDLGDDALFVVVQSKANRKLRFGDLSDKVKVNVNDGLDIDNIKASVTSVTEKCDNAILSINNVNNDLTSFQQTIQNRCATDENYGMVKLSSTLVDERHNNYGLRCDETGHAYIHVPNSGGGGITEKATNDTLGAVRLSTDLVDTKNGIYGLILNDDGNAYVKVPPLGEATDTTFGTIKLCGEYDDNDNRKYGVNKDEDGKAYVHVPWLSADQTWITHIETQLSTLNSYPDYAHDQMERRFQANQNLLCSLLYFENVGVQSFSCTIQKMVQLSGDDVDLTGCTLDHEQLTSITFKCIRKGGFSSWSSDSELYTAPDEAGIKFNIDLKPEQNDYSCALECQEVTEEGQTKYEWRTVTESKENEITFTKDEGDTWTSDPVQYGDPTKWGIKFEKETALQGVSCMFTIKYHEYTKQWRTTVENLFEFDYGKGIIADLSAKIDAIDIQKVSADLSTDYCQKIMTSCDAVSADLSTDYCQKITSLFKTNTVEIMENIGAGETLSSELDIQYHGDSSYSPICIRNVAAYSAIDKTEIDTVFLGNRYINNCTSAMVERTNTLSEKLTYTLKLDVIYAKV